MMTRAALLSAVTVLTACGPSLQQVNQAKEARYHAQYEEVWRAVNEVLRSHYKELKRVDHDNGILVTEWKLITKKAAGEVRGAASQAGARHGGDYFQARVLIVPGGPPWRIVIQGEGAEHRPDFAMLVPYKRGDSEEPVWVDGRINELYLEIHERLQKRAAGVEVAKR